MDPRQDDAPTSSARRRTLIAGLGDLGTQLVTRLAATGREIVGLRRRAMAVPGVRMLRADLSDRASLVAVLATIDGPLDEVVLCAAADAHSDDSYHRTYVDGTINLVGALRDNGHAPRIVFTSSTSVYGQTDGSWVDETSPTEPAGFAGVRMLEAERAVETSGLDHIVVRLGGLYGPDRRQLIDAVVSGRATVSAGSPQYTNRVHLSDAAAAVVHLLDLAAPERRYIGVDRDPADRVVVVNWLAARLSCPPPTPSATAGVTRGGNKRCRSDRLVASGFRFRYPSFRDGYGEMLSGCACR